MKDDIVYLVAIDTRGLPATDLQEGFTEIECRREYFVSKIVQHRNAKCIVCPLAEVCGLNEHLRLYFFEYVPGHGTLGERKGLQDDSQLQQAWSEFFPIGNNNAAATLLTIDPGSGYARYNIQGIAYAFYGDGSYPLSREQVWGLTELANEAKDVYFCDEFNRPKGRFELGRWCRQYRQRKWGPPFIYDPRKGCSVPNKSIKEAPAH